MATTRVFPEDLEIAVMAKAPIAGYAKTRLAASVGAKSAARLHRQFTLRTLQAAHHADIGPVSLWCAPSSDHRFFRALRAHCAVNLREQPEVDLGQRMAHVFAEQGERPLLLVGTDCPTLGAEHFRQAALALGSAVDAVFITTEDGGYVLVGLKRPLPVLFAGIGWSSAVVMAQTRDRLRALGLRWQEVAKLWDVDTAGDLARWLALPQSEASADGRMVPEHFTDAT